MVKYKFGEPIPLQIINNWLYLRTFISIVSFYLFLLFFWWNTGKSSQNWTTVANEVQTFNVCKVYLEIMQSTVVENKFSHLDFILNTEQFEYHWPLSSPYPYKMQIKFHITGPFYTNFSVIQMHGRKNKLLNVEQKSRVLDQPYTLIQSYSSWVYYFYFWLVLFLFNYSSDIFSSENQFISNDKMEFVLNHYVGLFPFPHN